MFNTDLSWVTNPYDYKLKMINSALIDIVRASTADFYVKDHLSLGNKRYIANNLNLDLASYSKILDLLSQVNYNILSINVAFDDDVVNDYNTIKWSLAIAGAKTFIFHMVNKILNLNWDLEDHIQLNIIHDKINKFYLYEFTLTDNNGMPLYVSDDTLINLNNEINITVNWGKYCIGSDPLIHYAINEIDDVILNRITYTKYGLFLIPTDITNEDDLNQIYELYYSFKRSNYITISNDTFNKYNILKEISLFWNLQEVYSDQTFKISVFKPNGKMTFWQSPDIWLNKAYEDIKNNLLPRYRWRYDFKQNVLYDNTYRLRIMYCLLQAYGQLINNDNPNLSIYLPDVYVYSDLTMEVRAASYNEIEKINNYLEYWLDLMNYIDVSYISTLEDALAARYYLADYKPLILYLDSHYYITYNVNNNDFINFPYPDKLEEIKVVIEKILQVYYNLTSEIGLNEMLNLIKLPSGVYEVNDLKIPVDPKTDRPLTEKQLFLIQNHRFSLYGYFPLIITTSGETIKDNKTFSYNILDYVPEKLYLKMELGKFVINQIDKACLTNYQVYFNNTFVQYMFNLITTNGLMDKSEEIIILIKQLWECGYFISDWAKNYYLLSGSYSQHLVYIYPYLKEAVASKEMSIIALRYLLILAELYCVKLSIK